jgi:tRNA (guanine-N7-)-methyltransferase
MTARQQRALEELWPTYGVELPAGPFDPASLYRRRAPLVLEIGFGMGEATVDMAAAEPERNVLAIDVHTPGAGALLHQLRERGLTNVRVMIGDAVGVLRDMLPPACLDEIRVYFPDPWPKGRHRKRRLVSPAFVKLASSRMRSRGRLHCATDWANYAQQIVDVIAAEPTLVNPHGGVAPRPPRRPVTRFERRGLAAGREVFDVIADKRS